MTQSPPPAAGPATPLSAADDKQWASFAHFGGILWFLPSLIIYLTLKDRGEQTRREAKEALNWQITWTGVFFALTIVTWILGGLIAVIAPVGVNLLFVGLFGLLTWIPYLANLVFSILGGLAVNGTGGYRYPFAIRLIK